jgi:flavin-dependent dehydrogenase
MIFDAIVIGAGPAGSTVARLLAASDWHVALVEKDEFPCRKVCGEFISAPTHAILDACGIGSAFRKKAGPEVRRIALFSSETMVTAATDRHWGRALGREYLDLMLRDAAVTAGATLFQPAELTTMARDGKNHICHLKTNGTRVEIAAPVLVAASGSWRIKPPLAVAAAARPSDLLAFKAHFAQSLLTPGTMPLLVFPGGYGGLVQSDGARTSLSCCIRRDALAALRCPGEHAGETVLRHIRAATRGVRAILQDEQPDGTILSAGPIRPGIRQRYRDGIFRTGNLAGEAHPIIAEGISMAIQSSHLLARHLVACGVDAGPGYAAEWRCRFGPRLAAASIFAHTAQHMPRLGTALIEFAPSLLSWGAKASGKVIKC